MQSFIVETYVTRLTAADLSNLIERLRNAAFETGVAHVRSYFVPEDEMCMHVFAATSLADVRAVTDRAGLETERIVQSVGEPADTTTRRNT